MLLIKDQTAIDYAQKHLALCSTRNGDLINDNFRHLKERLHELGVEEIDGICYDLGV